MGDYSMFMDPIDDIDCKKNFMRDTVSCDLDVNNAVRARIVGKNKGRFLSLFLSHTQILLLSMNQLHCWKDATKR